jgi:L-rhamnose mutarotase
MTRYGFMMRLKDESVIEEYERLHLDIGDEVRAAHTRAGFGNYSIFRHGLDLFGYFESADPEAAFARIEQEPIMESWWAKTNPLMETDGGKPLFIPIKQVFYME